MFTVYGRLIFCFIVLCIRPSQSYGKDQTYDLAAFGHDEMAEEPESQTQANLAELAESFTVKVLNRTAYVFAPEVESGHGSGFIVELNSDRGIVFTNRHVIDCDALDAQRLTLQFPVPEGLPEEIPAKLLYLSPFVDFAVLEFDPRKLRRAKKTLAAAPLADLADEKARQALRARHVMAFGHPLSSDNISTFGVVSGFLRDPLDGLFLQTTAPINPGNSGGPLIDIETGAVLAMNSMKQTDADNTGYSIPINRLIEAYDKFLEDPSRGLHRAIFARFQFISANSLKLEKSQKAIRSIIPDFFETQTGAFLVADAEKSTGLKTGDVILKIEGKVLGFNGSFLDELIYETKNGSVNICVLRNQEVLCLDVPVVKLGFNYIRQGLDFLYLGGLILRDLGPLHRWANGSGMSSVIVDKIVDYTPADEANQIHLGSLITELQIGNETFEVKQLQDAKRALKRWKKGQPVRVVYYAPHVNFSQEGGIVERDPAFGGPSISRHKSVLVLPIDSIITPKDLSLRLMKGNFDFSNRFPQTRDWRWWKGKTKQDCQDLLTESEDPSN